MLHVLQQINQLLPLLFPSGVGLLSHFIYKARRSGNWNLVGGARGSDREVCEIGPKIHPRINEWRSDPTRSFCCVPLEETDAEDGKEQLKMLKLELRKRK